MNQLFQAKDGALRQPNCTYLLYACKRYSEDKTQFATELLQAIYWSLIISIVLAFTTSRAIYLYLWSKLSANTAIAPDASCRKQLDLGLEVKNLPSMESHTVRLVVTFDLYNVNFPAVAECILKSLFAKVEVKFPRKPEVFFP